MSIVLRSSKSEEVSFVASSLLSHLSHRSEIESIVFQTSKLTERRSVLCPLSFVYCPLSIVPSFYYKIKIFNKQKVVKRVIRKL